MNSYMIPVLHTRVFGRVLSYAEIAALAQSRDIEKEPKIIEAAEKAEKCL